LWIKGIDFFKKNVINFLIELGQVVENQINHGGSNEVECKKGEANTRRWFTG